MLMRPIAIPFAIWMSSLIVLPVSSLEPRWFKGNTHAHTLKSDGNELCRRVARWYMDHEYNFLVITDHNLLTPVFTIENGQVGDFFLIPGEEVTDSFNNKSVHLTGINLQHAVKPGHGSSVVGTLQHNIDEINSAGGIAQINHPNYEWALSDTDILAVKEVNLMEIYNMNRDTNNYGCGGRSGTEDMWDRLLSKKYMIYGVISDDAHDYLGDFTPDKFAPGRGWIMVRAEESTPRSIVSALRKGDFYGTTGILLKDVRISPSQYEIEIVCEEDMAYTTTFIGKDGNVLKKDFNPKAAYTFKGDEQYVRAHISSSSGEFAITQPVFIPDRR